MMNVFASPGTLLGQLTLTRSLGHVTVISGRFVLDQVGLSVQSRPTFHLSSISLPLSSPKMTSVNHQKPDYGFDTMSSPPRQEFREKTAKIVTFPGVEDIFRYRAIVDGYVFLVSEELNLGTSKQKYKWLCVRHTEELNNCPACFYTTNLYDECVPFEFTGHNHEAAELVIEQYKAEHSRFPLHRRISNALPTPLPAELNPEPSPAKASLSAASVESRKRKAVTASPRPTNSKMAKLAEPVHLEQGPADSVDLFGDLHEEEERTDEYIPSVHGAHMKVEIGQNIVGKYFIVRKAGFGNSAIAWLAFDKKESKFCVLKIFKHPKDNMEEIKVLREAKALSHRPGGDKVVQMLDSFKVPLPRNKSISHHCISFEPCGFTLLSVMNHTGNGFEVPVVRKFLQHCLEALRFIHDDLGYIHTDIKPENILVSATDRSFFLEAQAVVESHYNGIGMRAVVNRSKPFVPPKTTMKMFQTILSQAPPPIDEELPELTIPPPDKSWDHLPERYRNMENRLTVNRMLMRPGTVFKICDIGNAMKPGFYDVDAATYEYRAPENVFREELTNTFDIWSLGATALETIFLEQAFKARSGEENNHDLLQQMTDVLGKISADLYPKVKRLNLKPSSAKFLCPIANINDRIIAHGFHRPEVSKLSELLGQMLCYDKDYRCTANEALNHAFFSE